MSFRCHRALLGLIGTLAFVPVGLSAQTIGLTLADGGLASLAAGAKLTVPLNVDLSAAGGQTLASLQADVSWGVGRLRLDSIRVVGASGFTLTANTTNLAAGSLRFNAFSATGLAASGALANLYFTGGTTSGGTAVDLVPLAAGSPAGQSLLAALEARGLQVCVAGTSWGSTTARWGDANGNGSVNVLDAQQLARYVVGLSVTNAWAAGELGDVTADGAIDILDAQQVARFSAGLSAAPRVNTVLTLVSDLPPVASVEVSTALDAVVVGQSRRYVATPRDADGNLLVGCYPISWGSSNTTVASVNSGTGVVLGKKVGSATITATSGGKTGNKAVEVQSPWVDISVGGYHTCGLRASGEAYCFGWIENGALFTPVPGGHQWAMVSSGTTFSCGVTKAGTGLCWGNGSFGALGNGSPDTQSSPTLVSGGFTWRSISAGEHHACGLTTEGETYCWGWNGRGQIGNNSLQDVSVPTRVVGDPGFASISAAGYQSCGLTAAGTGWCWGEGAGLVPTQMTTSQTWKSMTAGGAVSCGVSSANLGYCGVTALGATLLQGGYLWSQIARTRHAHLCGIISTGRAYCFGENGLGQLGNGSTVMSVNPAPVSGNLTWRVVSTGGYNSHAWSCGISTQGVAYCWGATEYGSLGITLDPTQQSLVPAEVLIKAP